MIGIFDLINKKRKVLKESILGMLHENTKIYTMFSARQERFAIFSPYSALVIKKSLKTTQRSYTYF